MTDYLAQWTTPMKYLNSKKLGAVRFAKLNGVESDDIEQTAMHYLTIAAQRFDPSRGVSFATFAHWYIWAAITRINQSMGNASAIPHHCKTSIDEVLDGDEFTLKESLGKEDEPQPETSEIAEIVRQELLKLPKRQAQILHLRFGLDGPQMTLREIGEALHLSKERIRQIENKAKAKLSRQLEASGISASLFGNAA